MFVTSKSATPVPTAVITALFLSSDGITVKIFEFTVEQVHDNGGFLIDWLIIALIVCTSPTFIVISVTFGSSVNDFNAACTTTRHSARIVLPTEFVKDAIILTSPFVFFTAVTKPLSSTLTQDGSVLSNFTVPS